MSAKESRYPEDWFVRAEADLEAAEILLHHGGDIGLAAYHAQQALEKYLKGYLLSRGWELERTHHLEALLDEAVKHKPDLEAFRSLCQEVAVYYFQSRYPFPAEGPTRREVEAHLSDVTEMISVVWEAMGRERPRRP